VFFNTKCAYIISMSVWVCTMNEILRHIAYNYNMCIFVCVYENISAGNDCEPMFALLLRAHTSLSHYLKNIYIISFMNYNKKYNTHNICFAHCHLRVIVIALRNFVRRHTLHLCIYSISFYTAAAHTQVSIVKSRHRYD